MTVEIWECKICGELINCQYPQLIEAYKKVEEAYKQSNRLIQSQQERLSK